MTFVYRGRLSLDVRWNRSSIWKMDSQSSYLTFVWSLSDLSVNFLPRKAALQCRWSTSHNPVSSNRFWNHCRCSFWSQGHSILWALWLLWLNYSQGLFLLRHWNQWVLSLNYFPIGSQKAVSEKRPLCCLASDLYDIHYFDANSWLLLESDPLYL